MSWELLAIFVSCLVGGTAFFKVADKWLRRERERFVKKVAEDIAEIVFPQIKERLERSPVSWVDKHWIKRIRRERSSHT